MLLVCLQFDEIAVELVGGVFLNPLTAYADGSLSCLLDVSLPEGVEICRVLGIWLQLLRRESHLHMVLEFPVAFCGSESEVEESRLFHCPDVYYRPSVLQFYLSFCRCGHHVGSYLIRHLNVLWHTVDIEPYLHLRLLASLIDPVGMVGLSQPEIVRTIGIVFRL